MASHKNDAITDVLEYYQKHSQNSNLSKYFSGLSVPSLSDTKVPIQLNDPDTIKTCSFTKKLSDNLSLIDCKSKENLDKDVSDKSSSNSALVSPSDNKKLEWDSGADIGYHIFQNSGKKETLRRCFSLPVLDNYKNVKLNFEKTNLKSVQLYSSDSSNVSNVNILVLSSTSGSTATNQKSSENSSTLSDIMANEKKQIRSDVSTSSTSEKLKKESSSESSGHCDSEELKLTGFKTTLSFLKEKIGLPGAHSTPNIECSNKNKDFDKDSVITEHFLEASLKKITQHGCGEKESVSQSHKSSNSQGSDIVVKSSKKPPKNQSTFSKNVSALETNKKLANSSKELNQLHKKVIELSISSPINICFECPKNVAKDKETTHSCDLVPKAVQTDSLLKLEYKCQEIELKATEHQSGLPSLNTFDRNPHIIPDNISDYASSCNSFEYISNSVAKHKQDLQASQHSFPKTDLLETQHSKHNISGYYLKCDSNQNSPLSSGVSKSESEDIYEQVELLQTLLKSKKLDIRSKKNSIRKLIWELNNFECNNDSSASSELFSPKKDEGKLKSSRLHAKGSNQSSDRPKTSEEDCILKSSENKFIHCKKDKTQSEDLAEKKESSDYLLKFADNERAYQISWIKNEISHLTKLKSILEHKKFNINTQRSTSSGQEIKKTSVYRITQNDGSTKSSERDYIIQTKLDILPGEEINYCLEGKNYLVTSDQKIPQTDLHSNKEDTKNALVADIKFQAKENQTNIKVNTLCHVCKQLTCICSYVNSENDEDSHRIIPDWDTQEQVSKMACEYTCKKTEKTRSCNECSHSILIKESVKSCHNVDQEVPLVPTNKTLQPCTDEDKKKPVSTNFWEFTDISKGKEHSSYTSASSGSNVIKESVNRRDKFVATSKSVFSTQPSADKGTVTETNAQSSQFDSLQKIFEKCCCTLGSRNCNCQFVKKLLGRFLLNDKHDFKNVPTYIGNGNTNRILIDHECQTSPSFEIKSKEQFMKNGFSDKAVQARESVSRTSRSNTKETKEIVDVLAAKQSINQNKRTNNLKINKEEVEKNGIVDDEKDVLINRNKYNTNSTTSHTGHTGILSGEFVYSEIKPIEDTHEESQYYNKENISTYKKLPDIKIGVRKEKQNKNMQNMFDNNTHFSKSNLGSINITKCKDTGVQACIQLKNGYSQTSVSDLNTNNTTDLKKSSVIEKIDEVLSKLSGKQGNSNNIGLLPQNYEGAKKNEIKKDGMAKVTSRSQFLNNVDTQKTTPKTSELGLSCGVTTEYSRSEVTSGSIPTSVSNSRSILSSRITCSCCMNKAFVAEVSYKKNGNTLCPICSKCYYNKPAYSAKDSQKKCKSQKILCGHKPFCNNCCGTGIELSPNPKGVAYTLIIEEQPKKQISRKSFKNNKFNRLNNQKSLKNKENSDKKYDLYIDPSEIDKNNKDDNMPQQRTKKQRTHNTLTDYLITNRPEFICSAEYRRQIMLNSRIQRMQHKDNLKLHFLESNLNNVADKGQYKLYTEREMKQINKKIYENLPEIRNKQSSIRDKNLRHADKLISESFAKKVQKSVLQGKRNFPIDKTVIDLY